jgi:Ca2+-binding RTX toxin-like protein
MKRTMLLIATMMLALLMTTGVALAQVGVDKVCNTNCHGTDGDDRLIGTANPNTIKGLKGADLIQGNPANDTLYGNLGGDAVYGGNRVDQVDSGNGNDYANGGRGHDRISTGAGEDVVAARDGYKDRINCGSDYDKICVDRIDVLQGCEKKLNAKPQPQI